ncbi:MAG: hypothetical protein ACKVX7_20240 [Planctomycetota bacterium]
MRTRSFLTFARSSPDLEKLSRQVLFQKAIGGGSVWRLVELKKF